jgi:hypothetical protein
MTACHACAARPSPSPSRSPSSPSRAPWLTPSCTTTLTERGHSASPGQVFRT